MYVRACRGHFGVQGNAGTRDDGDQKRGRQRAMAGMLQECEGKWAVFGASVPPGSCVDGEGCRVCEYVCVQVEERVRDKEWPQSGVATAEGGVWGARMQEVSGSEEVV